MDGLNRVIGLLDKVGTFSRWTNVIGVSGFFIMICFSFVDVIMRYVFHSPMRYVTELVEVMMIVSIFLAIAHTQNVKSHVAVDLITSKLSAKARLIMEFLTIVLGLGIFAIIIWQTIEEIPWVLANNTIHTQSFHVSKAPFLAIIALGSICLWLLLLRDLLQKVVDAQKLGMKQYQWVLMFVLPAIALTLAGLWTQPTVWQTGLTTAGLIGIFAALLLFLIGMPISFALLLVSFIFTFHIRGSNIAFDILATDIYRTTGTYSFSAVNFFVLVGYFCLFAGFGADLYHAAYKWFGHLRGGLAIATVGACTGYAAIVGDSLSATATMGAVALPEMKKFKYDDRLSAGSICGGAFLGPIIPPSVTFVFYGLFTKMSIGDLFVAGIIPGVIIALIFCAIIIVWCQRNPSIGPPGEKSTWGPRIVSLKAGGPVLILFVLVIGGIYMGVFTPTEGGSIGAMISFLLGLGMRRFTWKNFTNAMLESGKVISMIFLIIIGAVLFTRFAAWCNMSQIITNFFTGLGLSPMVFAAVVLFIFLILGCIMDIMPLLLIGVPILHPIAVSMGLNPIWFAVLVVLVINLGALTPPVGLILFVFKGMAKDIPMATVYRGAIPFVIGILLGMVLLFFIPSLATWLPAVLK
jgi:tripartite ATP-independent transporter DctM subunit